MRVPLFSAAFTQRLSRPVGFLFGSICAAAWLAVAHAHDPFRSVGKEVVAREPCRFHLRVPRPSEGIAGRLGAFVIVPNNHISRERVNARGMVFDFFRDKRPERNRLNVRLEMDREGDFRLRHSDGPVTSEPKGRLLYKARVAGYAHLDDSADAPLAIARRFVTSDIVFSLEQSFVGAPQLGGPRFEIKSTAVGIRDEPAPFSLGLYRPTKDGEATRLQLNKMLTALMGAQHPDVVRAQLSQQLELDEKGLRDLHLFDYQPNPDGTLQMEWQVGKRRGILTAKRVAAAAAQKMLGDPQLGRKRMAELRQRGLTQFWQLDTSERADGL